MAIENSVGTGLVFPIIIDNTGKPVTKTGFDLINSSIRIILSWQFKSRIFLSEFGSRLDDLLEEPNDIILKQLVEHFTYEALRRWETRIDILEVYADAYSATQMRLSIRYRIKNSNLENTFVFPYYKEVIY